MLIRRVEVVGGVVVHVTEPIRFSDGSVKDKLGELSVGLPLRP